MVGIIKKKNLIKRNYGSINKTMVSPPLRRGYTGSSASGLTLSLPKKQTTNFRLQIFKKNVKSKLYHIENSKTRGQQV